MSDNGLNPWATQRAAIGAYLRHQRELANMSLRQLSQATQVSNAYLSQIERGLHDPSLRVLIQIGAALQFSVEEMLREGSGHEMDGTATGGARGVERAVHDDPHLSAAEKEALLAVYRSFLKSRPEAPLVSPATGADFSPSA